MRLKGKFVKHCEIPENDDLGNMQSEIELPAVDINNLTDGDELLVKVKLSSYYGKPSIRTDDLMFLSTLRNIEKNIVAVLPQEPEKKADDWEQLKKDITGNGIGITDDVKAMFELVDLVKDLSDQVAKLRGKK
jgi:hypothetical protein